MLAGARFLFCVLFSIASVVEPHRPSNSRQSVFGTPDNLALLGRSKNRYGIIIDAGSTQTRLYIYQWEGPSNASFSAHVKPYTEIGTGNQAHFIKDGGIADMDPSDLPDFLSDMVKYAQDQLPSNKHGTIPIFIKATAGVRILSESKRVSVVETLKEYLSDRSKSSFLFDKNLGVQVLSGEFEGAFDWLSINYLAGTLRKESVEKSVISIDMGGSSLELTFEPTDTLMEGAFPLRVNGTDFGRNQALLRYRQDLLAEFPDDKVVYDPCFPKGYEESLFSNRRKVRLSGTGNYNVCLLLTRKLLRESKFCPSEPCAMNGVYQPDLPTNRPIVAIDSFAKLAQALGCAGKSSIDCLERMAHQSCQDAVFTGEVHQLGKLQRTKCFVAAYVTNVLRHGFRIDPLRPIWFSDEDNDGTSTGWTIGAMIYELELRSFNNGDCGLPDLL
ncbi:hypothetical protein DSO57_1027686 [Entomophthora muscae]|uniref:Uncharacterized protein n=1 Tax=Entomophthora muscae TaxID=34485 RepID=A0ACC2RSJ5_9FUNG|nr:hypothetical protein DSO57_1027686 [Entomophthora muscae]